MRHELELTAVHSLVTLIIIGQIVADVILG